MELKSKSSSATDVSDAVSQEESKENVDQLKKWLEQFSRCYSSALLRKERCQKLMRRKSSKKWNNEKTSKMVRRLSVAEKEIEQSGDAIDQMMYKLSKLGETVDSTLVDSTSVATSA